MSAATFEQALARYRKVGASKAADSDVMAAFCQHDLQILVGAVSPRLVWDGAMSKHMTLIELARLAHDNPRAVADLMWL